LRDLPPGVARGSRSGALKRSARLLIGKGLHGGIVQGTWAVAGTRVKKVERLRSSSRMVRVHVAGLKSLLHKGLVKAVGGNLDNRPLGTVT
jgi:hypothetical protein